MAAAAPSLLLPSAVVVVLAGIFLGLLTGALASLVLLAARRASWRTALPFAPPLMTGAVLALALAGPAVLG